MFKKYDYNLIVIGGGAAGLVSSYIASAVKAKVLLVEKNKMGGDCLNYGCVPSKAIIKTASVLDTIKKASSHGIKTGDVQFNFEDAMKRVHDKIKAIEPHDSVERYTNLGVDCIVGNAKLIDKHTVKIDGKIHTGKNIIIATGAQPFIRNIDGIENSNYLTSETIWELKKLPKEFVIIGGGPIGCELAQTFARLGSNVTIINRGNSIMSNFDNDVIDVVETTFKNENINIINNAKIENINNNEINVNGQKIPFDNILIATGRMPRVENFGLEQIGIKTNKNKTIKVNQFLQTSVKNIYACGDVAGPYQFTHTAAHQAWYACVNSLFGFIKKFKVNYDIIPFCTFTDPEVSQVGISENYAIENNIKYDVYKYGIDDLDRAIVDSNDIGFVKVITKKNSDKILGVTIVGVHAGEIISEFIIAMKHNIGLNSILGTIHIYPTYSEANKYAAGIWKKASAKPYIFKILKKLHSLWTK